MSTDLAWAAGFIDGEGSFHVTTRTNRAGKKISRLTLSVGQSDPRPLERLALIANHGNVGGPYSHTTDPLRKKPTYQWRIGGQTAWRFVEELWPYLSEPKKEQVQRCRQRIAEAI